MKKEKRVRLVMVVIVTLVLWRGLVGIFQDSVLCNVTASMPLGLYLRQPLEHAPRRGQLVYVQVPPHVQRLVYERRYIPKQAQLVKHVFGLPGDVWCVSFEEGFTINGQKIGGVEVRDTRGEILPLWAKGCHQVASGHVLIGAHAQRSFDSRYFGPVPQSSLLSEVEPLWTYTP